MTTIQLKAEIKNTLDEIPESSLPVALELLKKIRSGAKGEDPELIEFMKLTLIEDKELLEKLAQ
jgi:hypothetical protein